MKEKISQFLDIDIEDLKEITKEQKTALRASTTNLFSMPRYFTRTHIIFTSEDSMKHWQYYAGFEYVPDPDIMRKGDEFIAAYSTDNDPDDRIQRYIDILESVTYL